MLDSATVPRWQARFGSHFYSHQFVCSLPRWFNVLDLYASRTMRCKRRPPCGCNFRSLNNISHEIYELVVRMWAAAAAAVFYSKTATTTKHKCNGFAPSGFHILPSTGKWTAMSFPFHSRASSVPDSFTSFWKMLRSRHSTWNENTRRQREEIYICSSKLNSMERIGKNNCRNADTLIARNSNYYQSFGRVWWIWMNLDVFDRVDKFEFHMAIAFDSQPHATPITQNVVFAKTAGSMELGT